LREMPVDVGAIVLAAGHGTRMKSTLAKVLHPMAGHPMVHYPIVAALGAGASELVLVVGPHNETALKGHVAEHYPGAPIRTSVQAVARGTGDAARAGLAGFSAPHDWTLILCGDTPLVRAEDLRMLLDAARSEPKPEVWVMTCVVDEPYGYGRIVKDLAGNVLQIVEQRDLSGNESEIREINSGIYLAKRNWLDSALGELKPNNAQGEYYLTDIVRAAHLGAGARSVQSSPEASLGVNDPDQLRALEQKLLARSVG
jgi:bifunctional UDP-N-acetylglucosamine pyrophosphorylase / glucosamine-1-phosphate N-acetyltransferase